ncbi:MAG: discoidin domain-containing protein, partial [Byssovorax sp.]
TTKTRLDQQETRINNYINNLSVGVTYVIDNTDTYSKDALAQVHYPDGSIWPVATSSDANQYWVSTSKAGTNLDGAAKAKTGSDGKTVLEHARAQIRAKYFTAAYKALRTKLDSLKSHVDSQVKTLNLAHGKTASQSSTYLFAPSKALDGDASTYSQTGTGAQPWWKVDLGSAKKVNVVTFIGAQQDSLKVQLFDANNTSLGAAVAPIHLGGGLYSADFKKSARYVKISRNVNSQLLLKEVWVVAP